MGLRGPQPVNVNHLQEHARAWAWFFYTLRDGQSGYMQRVQSGRLKRKKIGGKSKISYRIAKALSPPILIPVSDAARVLPRKTITKDLVVFRPVMPAPEMWERIKKARTDKEIRAASLQIRSWITNQFGEGVGRWLPSNPGDPSVEFCDALDLYAENVLIGKQMPSYAKTDRPKSDNKRVEFLAKVLAGASFGLAPITAAKRLSHWHQASDSAERTLKEFIGRQEREFAERKKGPKP